LKGETRKFSGSKGEILDFCDKCYRELSLAIHGMTHGASYSRAIFLGLTFGIVGAIIWFLSVVLSGWQLGIVAIGVGLLTGLGVSIGSKRKANNKRDTPCPKGQGFYA